MTTIEITCDTWDCNDTVCSCVPSSSHDSHGGRGGSDYPTGSGSYEGDDGGWSGNNSSVNPNLTVDLQKTTQKQIADLIYNKTGVKDEFLNSPDLSKMFGGDPFKLQAKLRYMSGIFDRVGYTMVDKDYFLNTNNNDDGYLSYNVSGGTGQMRCSLQYNNISDRIWGGPPVKFLVDNFYDSHYTKILKNEYNNYVNKMFDVTEGLTHWSDPFIQIEYEKKLREMVIKSCKKDYYDHMETGW